MAAILKVVNERTIFRHGDGDFVGDVGDSPPPPKIFVCTASLVHFLQ